jgi:transcriptional regulator with XRE-family HTH domain
MARTLDDLAALLRDLRRRHARSRRDSSLTYRELAAKSGFSVTAIAEYFSARTLPPTDRLDALLELLGATPDEHRALATARDRIEDAVRRARGRQARGRQAAAGPESPGSFCGPPQCVPRQLPAAPVMFTGRVRELACLDRISARSGTDGPPVISAIGGMGGIGKTWLALQWAHNHLDRFPDGQLYVNMRGFDPLAQPVTSADLVRGFLEALGVAPAEIPATLEARAALYRSLTAGKRMLVMLDDARDTAQVAPLLPGAALGTVLITSRRRLTGLITTHGARSMTLDVLSQADAPLLLARHLGAARLAGEPDATATVLDCCAGLPLALSIIATHATTAPDMPLSDLAAELSDAGRRLDALDAGEPAADLRAVLAASSHALRPAAARAFGLLGIAPGTTIALEAASTMLALPLAATRTLMRELDNAHLVQACGPGRYRMHDLVKLHAAEHARGHQSAAEIQAALRRLAASGAGAQPLGRRRVVSLMCEPAC